MLECSSAEMSLNMNTMRKKSNASSVQPKYAAITTLRWLLVHVIWHSLRTHRGKEYQLPFATAGVRSMNKGEIEQIAATIIIPRQTPGRAAMRDAAGSGPHSRPIPDRPR